MKMIPRGGHLGRLLLVFGLVTGAAGCDSLLDVTNPATFGDEALNEAVLGPQLVSGVVARFQEGYDNLALFSAIITDEAVTGHNFETIQRVDLRQVTKENSGDVYLPLQRTRAAADSFEARLIRVAGDTATRSLGLARIQGYGALTYVLMGEFLCAAPVDPTQGAVSPDSMFRIGITRANRAIQTATAFKAAGGAAARADSIINFARVSAARAHLNLGEMAQAAALAAQVPAAFELRSFYDETNETNVFFGSTTGANSRNLGVDVAFRGLNDPRVRHAATGVTGHDQATALFIPSLAPSFGNFSTTTARAFTRSTNIRISSGLEAQYIVAEAQGLNATNLAFVNARRAIGGLAPLVSPTAAEYMAALRDVRRRDFFLDGHRLGDLRRYMKLYNLNLFPTGQHPTPGRGEYGTDTCFVPTTAEIVGNPGYRP